MTIFDDKDQFWPKYSKLSFFSNKDKVFCRISAYQIHFQSISINFAAVQTQVNHIQSVITRCQSGNPSRCYNVKILRSNSYKFACEAYLNIGRSIYTMFFQRSTHYSSGDLNYTVFNKKFLVLKKIWKFRKFIDKLKKYF